MKKISVDGIIVSKREYTAKDKQGHEIGRRFQYNVLSTSEPKDGGLPESAELIGIFKYDEDIKATVGQKVIVIGELNGDYSNWQKITLIK